MYTSEEKSIKMNNKDIEVRLQNIINADKLTSKQMALKTKLFYKKLHFLGEIHKCII